MDWFYSNMSEQMEELYWLCLLVLEFVYLYSVCKLYDLYISGTINVEVGPRHGFEIHKYVSNL